MNADKGGMNADTKCERLHASAFILLYLRSSAFQLLPKADRQECLSYASSLAVTEISAL